VATDPWRDRVEIAEIHRFYAYCIDTRQPQRLIEIFADDVEAHYGYGPDGVWRSAVEVAEGLGAQIETFEASCHLMGNIQVDIDGDVARTSAYVNAWHWLKELAGDSERPADFMFCGVYVDDVRREEEGWRIERRRFRRLGPSAIAVGTMPDALRPRE
jgi:SnoaL-like domain